METAAKVAFQGQVHVTSGRQGAAKSRDGFLDVAMPEPHPAAEDLFASAWSACFIGAIRAAAAQKKVRLPSDPEMITEIDLNDAGNLNYFLTARLNVKIPGLERKVVESLVEVAHQLCPYSKATRGNVDVTLNVLD